MGAVARGRRRTFAVLGFTGRSRAPRGSQAHVPPVTCVVAIVALGCSTAAIASVSHAATGRLQPPTSPSASQGSLGAILPPLLTTLGAAPSSNRRETWSERKGQPDTKSQSTPTGRRSTFARFGAASASVVVGVQSAIAKGPPEGLTYERLQAGTSAEGPRNGPPITYSKIWLKYTGHLDGFEGPVFDSSHLKGKRKPGRRDYAEVIVNSDQLLPPGGWEACKLMKVGERGRAIVPPDLSWPWARRSFDADEDADVKTVPASATLYYDLELVGIIRP